MTLTEQRPAPAPLVAPYAPSWWLHLYDEIGYLTFDGKVVAVATCSTPVQETRLIVLLDRLTNRTAREHR